ncbi:hypothetical protein LSH36_161g06023 [Paralvinella palmiformis]|uniref:Uncharacterized protein n=1 Tax=Paralvinella palmiformis TaxID=53620 RepID=A0AAD9JTN8_9ANNE|nr:hypothetical protein LSH36_161g06023 [Paralvinella palmiformis]
MLKHSNILRLRKAVYLQRWSSYRGNKSWRHNVGHCDEDWRN